LPEFKNMVDLDRALKPLLKDVVNAVAKRVEDKIIANIDEYVYIGRNEYYYDGSAMPTYEFRESWKSDGAKSIPNGFEAEIYSHYDMMRLDKDTFLHGSYWGDVRKYLPEIIEEGLSGKLFGEGFWREKRPFFSKTIEQLESQGLIQKWYIEEFRKRGLQVQVI